MRIKKILLSLFFVVLIFSVSLSILKISERTSLEKKLSEDTLSYQEQISLWQQHINQYGMSASYDFLLTLAEEKKVNGIDRHVLGHLFGEALYDIVGIEGFLLCDNQTEYGCVHEIASHALSDYGIDAVLELNDLCIETFQELSYACQHGIGHGLFSSTGYSHDDLLYALSVCERLPENNFHSGCNSGVFMEYLFQTTLDNPSYVLPYNDDFLEPCRGLSLQQMGACSLRLPDWWMSTILELSTTTENINALGELCTEASITLEIPSSLCFSGIGNSLILQTNYDSSAVIQICDASSRDPEDQFWCKKVAAKHFLDGGTLEGALSICKSMDEISETQCSTEVRQQNSINTKLEARF